MSDHSTHAPVVLDAENPWPGLHEFDECGQRYFNGRAQESAELARQVRDAALTVLFGASGLGKTSLLKAGLMPKLSAEHYLPIYLRIDPRDRKAPLIEQVSEGLRGQLARGKVDHPSFPADESLWEYLHRKDLEFWSAQNELLIPVVILDQFEELFTLGAENRDAVRQLRDDLADLIENRVPGALAVRLERADFPLEQFSLNLGEVVDGLIELIKNPDLTIQELMKDVKAPDFPTGGIIYGYEGVAEAFQSGRGRVVMRARVNTEVLKSGREQLVITEFPYQVNKAQLIEKIAELVKEKRLEDISNIRDESDRDGVRVVVELKRDATPEVVLNNLYKHTQMQQTFGVIMLALVDGRPRVLNLKEVMEHFLKHRNEVVVRRTQFDLEAAERRAHIL